MELKEIALLERSKEQEEEMDGTFASCILRTIKYKITKELEETNGDMNKIQSILCDVIDLCYKYNNYMLQVFRTPERINDMELDSLRKYINVLKGSYNSIVIKEI